MGAYIYGQNRHRSAWDSNGDSFSELPKLKNQTVGVNAYYRLSPYSKLNLEYHHMEEFRRGGNRFDLPPHIAEDANLNGSGEPGLVEQIEHSINTGGLKFSPAFSVDKKIRQALYEDAVKIAKHVGYVNAGTLEFLVDREGHHYFIEMNPRIQVEHTVTEMVTGVDLVRSQILIAEGCPLSDPRIGIRKQSDLHLNGYAIQCRVTTEDPANNFAPDTGKITAYRSAGGFGMVTISVTVCST